MKTVTTILIYLVVSTLSAQNSLNLSDFEILNNTQWKGQLTYKDYQSGKQQTIDATMQIKIEGKKITSSVQYTYEPNKNNTYSVKLKKNGTYFGNEKVISNTFKNGTRTFITTYEGRDNGKKATMYITHQFNDTSYTFTKEVQYENETERFTRNTYQFNKL